MVGLSANNLHIPTTITALAIDPLSVWVQSTVLATSKNGTV